MLLVVAFEGGAVEVAQFEGHDAQALALEAGEDLTDEASLDGIGLQDDEGAVGHSGRAG
jgi:hypothetical protein